MALGPYQEMVEKAYMHGGPKPFLESVEATGFLKGVVYGQKRMYSIAGEILVVGTVLGAVVTKGATKLKERRQLKKHASIKIECNDLGKNFNLEFTCTDLAFSNSSDEKEVAA